MGGTFQLKVMFLFIQWKENTSFVQLYKGFSFIVQTENVMVRGSKSGLQTNVNSKQRFKQIFGGISRSDRQVGRELLHLKG